MQNETLAFEWFGVIAGEKSAPSNAARVLSLVLSKGAEFTSKYASSDRRLDGHQGLNIRRRAAKEY